MSKKHIIVIILQSVVIVILGTVLFKQKESTNFFKINEAFLQDEIKRKEIDILKMGDLIKKADKDFIEKVKVDKNCYFNDSYFWDVFSHPLWLSSIYRNALSILDLTKELEKEIEQNIDIDTKGIIDFLKDNYFYDNNRLTLMIELLNNSNYDSREKKYILLLIKNHYLQECISRFDNSIPLAYGRVVNYAERDTVTFGETYRSQIRYEAIDVAGNIVIFENGDTLKYGNFEEQAIKRGHNHRKGQMEITGKERSVIYEVNIDYYVR